MLVFVGQGVVRIRTVSVRFCYNAEIRKQIARFSLIP